MGFALDHLSSWGLFFGKPEVKESEGEKRGEARREGRR